MVLASLGLFFRIPGSPLVLNYLVVMELNQVEDVTSIGTLIHPSMNSSTETKNKLNCFLTKEFRERA